ncbi:MAG: hypothetical protein AABW56_03235 [Nanoarchaeota archaeon]
MAQDIVDNEIKRLVSLDSFGNFDLLDASHGNLNLRKGLLFNGYILGKGKPSKYMEGFEFIKKMQKFFDEFNLNKELEFFQPLYYVNHFPRLYVALYPSKRNKLFYLNLNDYDGFLRSQDRELLDERYLLMKKSWQELDQFLKK